MAQLVTASFAGSSPTQGGRLFADARDQQPFEPGEWGLKVVFSGHFCTSHHVGHARRKQAGIKIQECLPVAQIKTNKVLYYKSFQKKLISIYCSPIQTFWTEKLFQKDLTIFSKHQNLTNQDKILDKIKLQKGRTKYCLICENMTS